MLPTVYNNRVLWIRIPIPKLPKLPQLPQPPKSVLGIIIVALILLAATRPTKVETVEVVKYVNTTDTVKIIEKEIIKDTVVIERGYVLAKPNTTPKLLTVNNIKESIKKSKKTVPITNYIKDKNYLEFICHNEVLKRAIEVQKETGILATVAIVQKGLESRWGNSGLTKTTKTLGNIKCRIKEHRKHNYSSIKKGHIGHIGTHCTQLYDDHPWDRFVNSSTYEEGWNKYKSLIKSRYSSAAKSRIPESQVSRIKELGYATDDKYVKKIMSVYNKEDFAGLQKAIDEGYTITSQTGLISFN